MKASPIIRLTATALLAAVCLSPATAAPKRATTYYTVLEGSKVVLECPFKKENPGQVLWVKGKMGVMSLDGEDFYSMAQMLDPKLGLTYSLESDDSSSSLVINEAVMNDQDLQHAGLYKCIIDLYDETKFELAVLKRDFRCRFVGPLIGLSPDDPIRVGTDVQIECSVTKDKSPTGKVDFSLFIGEEEVDSTTVMGDDLWKEGSNVAKVRYNVTMKESHLDRAMVAKVKIDLKGDDLTTTISDQLRLTYDIRVDCPHSQFFILGADEDDYDDEENHPSLLPHCLVRTAAPLQSRRRVDWVIRGGGGGGGGDEEEGGRGEEVRSVTSYLGGPSIAPDLPNSTYRAFLGRDIAEKSFRLPLARLGFR